MNILYLGPKKENIYNFLLNNSNHFLHYEDKLSDDSELLRDIDFIISYGYRHIISKQIINKFPQKILNLHISLLPWNRGASPNFWSFIDDTPKGVTIHQIDEGLDTGNILIQKNILFDENEETLATSYEKLNVIIQELLIENWNKLCNQEILPKKQKGKCTIHKQKEFEMFKSYVGDKIYTLKINELKQIYRKYLDEKIA